MIGNRPGHPVLRVTVTAPAAFVRSRERHGLEETALVNAIGEMIAQWRRRGQWERLQCIELLWVAAG